MTAPCYGHDVDDAQRDELLRRRQAIDQAVGNHDAALAARNEQLIALRRQGIGATDLTRVLSQGRAHPVNRVTVARILAKAGTGRDPLDRTTGRAFGEGDLTQLTADHAEARARLRAAQARVDTAAAAVTRAVDDRDATVIRLATADRVGATEQAGVLDMSPKTVQEVVNRHRVAERRRSTLDDQ